MNGLEAALGGETPAVLRGTCTVTVANAPSSSSMVYVVALTAAKLLVLAPVTATLPNVTPVTADPKVAVMVTRSKDVSSPLDNPSLTVIDTKGV